MSIMTLSRWRARLKVELHRYDKLSSDPDLDEELERSR